VHRYVPVSWEVREVEGSQVLVAHTCKRLRSDGSRFEASLVNNLSSKTIAKWTGGIIQAV
jgi:hypothetical protein